MRLIWTAPAALLAIAGLSGCQSEESYRANLRTQAIANCKSGARTNTQAAAQLNQVGLSVDDYCTCAIDRYMRSASYDELKKQQNNPAPPGLMSAGMQCVSDHVQRIGAGSAAPAQTNAAPAAPESAPAAPAEGEANEENSAAEQ